MLRRLATLAVAVACVAYGDSAVWGQVKLALKYPDNIDLVTHSQVKTKQTLNIGGQDVETENDAFVVTRSKFGARGSDGSLVSNDKVETLQVNLKIAGMELQFDSGNPDKKADNPLLEPVMEIFRATSRMTSKVTRDKDNKVVKVEFPQEELDKLSDAIRKEFDPEKRKEQAQQETSFLPSKEVKSGDTWESSTTANLGGGQTMDLGAEYTYAGTVTEEGKTLHKVTMTVKTVKYQMDQNAESPVKITGSELKPTESSGEYLLDLEAGRITKAVSKIRIQGDLQMSVGGMNLPGKLDLTIETNSKLQP